MKKLLFILFILLASSCADTVVDCGDVFVTINGGTITNIEMLPKNNMQPALFDSIRRNIFPQYVGVNIADINKINDTILLPQVRFAVEGYNHKN